MLYPFFNKVSLLYINFRTLFLSFCFIVLFSFFEVTWVRQLYLNTLILFKIISTKILCFLFKNPYFLSFLDPFTLIIFSNNLVDFVSFLKLDNNTYGLKLFAFLFYKHFLNLQPNNLVLLFGFFKRFHNMFDFVYLFCLKLVKLFCYLLLLNFSYAYLFTRKDLN